MKRLLWLLAVFALLFGCAAVNKAKAGSALTKVQLEIAGASIDSFKTNPDLFEKLGTATKNFLPNPQVVVIVQDLARGIISSELGTLHLSIFLNATLPDSSTDTIWVHEANATLELDSLYKLPLVLSAADSLQKIAPGKNEVRLKTELPVDSRLFKILDVTELKLTGSLTVSLKQGGAQSTFEFNKTRQISEEEKSKLVETARDNLLKTLVGDWVEAILP